MDVLFSPFLPLALPLSKVRDILLNKILFSGAMLTDEHNVIGQSITRTCTCTCSIVHACTLLLYCNICTCNCMCFQIILHNGIVCVNVTLFSSYTVHRQDDTLNGAHPLQTAMHAPTAQLSQEHVTLGSNGGTSPSDRTEEEVSSTAERHPLMSSTEESGRDGEDWVHLSTSHGHPLVSSDS